MSSDRLFELRRRTFNTPAFRGIEFIEVEARSIINHVPGESLPFDWTINAYRGCSHACVYCLHGETKILMADGRIKDLADIRVGDAIYGTSFDGRHRRYVPTRVLAHWSTVKPAYRVTLADRTEIIASGDHRFLTAGRGWKYVTGAMSGVHRRPYLTTDNELMGTGRFAAPPVHDQDYRTGYLCGMVRGDANLGSYHYARAGRRHGDVHRFRLALTDLEPLYRTREFLEAIDIATDEFVFTEAAGSARPMTAIRTQRRASFEAITDVIRWPQHATRSWCKGFLAGIFDAEGSYSRGILRISNCDPDIVDMTIRCLRRLGFFYVRETQKRPEGSMPISCIRLLGGIVDALRFFHTTDPATTRKRTIDGAAIKNDARLRVTSIEPLGVELPMFDITTGTGDFIANGVVSHNCFARKTHTYMDMDAGRDFETKIVVKVNAPQLLRKELRAKRWRGDHIAMGTATDPYQRAEGRYRLTRGIIETLTEYRNPFSILTKGTLILRDLDVLSEAARLMEVSTAFSIPTLDEDVWRASEPGTPHPRKRLEAVARLNDAGVPCGVMIAPILPGISDADEQIRAVVEAAIEAGATHASPILLHLRPVVRDVYMSWLRDSYPELVPSYEAMYPRAYASSKERNALGARVRRFIEDAGGLRPRVARVHHWRRPPRSASAPAPTEQLSLL